MAALALLALVAAAPWPPSSLDKDSAARVERGETVKTNALSNGVIRFGLAARIDTPAESAIAAARDLCAAASKEKDAPQVWYLLPKGVEAFLARAAPDVADEALRNLPATDCRGASALPRHYVLVYSPGRFPFPESKSLLRRDVVVGADGMSMTTTQVLGGLGGSSMQSETKVVPMPNGATAFVEQGHFKLPDMIPDFVVRGMMDTPDDKNPQLKRLADLRALAKKLAASAAKPAPPADAGPGAPESARNQNAAPP